MAKKPGLLDPLRARVRRLQLVVGMGFLAFVLGSIVSASLVMRLQVRMQGIESVVVGFFVHALVSRLWVYGVFPAMCYAAGRIFDLRPWSTAIGGALTGELFLFGIEVVNRGLAGVHRHWLETTLRACSLALGIALARWAIVQARAASERAEQEAAKAAEARTAEYQSFLAEAERVASLREQSPPTPPAERQTKPEP